MPSVKKKDIWHECKHADSSLSVLSWVRDWWQLDNHVFSISLNELLSQAKTDTEERKCEFYTADVFSMNSGRGND